MLSEAPLPDSQIAAAIRSHYDIAPASLASLPIGNDAAAWSYRVESSAGRFFLKLRRGAPNPGCLLAPLHLRRQGIAEAVAPRLTRAGELCVPLAGYTLAIYPWIEGESGWGRRLSARQFRAWGGIMRRVHSAAIDAELAGALPRETFDQPWLRRLAAVERALAAADQHDHISRELARFWHRKAAVIARVSRRYSQCSQRFAKRSPALGLCHADIHQANIMLDAGGGIHIVDWDEAIFAPIERDLMFFIDDGQSERETAAFLNGYGDAPIDQLGLAYYRYDWALQEICDDCERVLIMGRMSAAERERALDAFRQLFHPDDVIARADRAYDAAG